MKNPSETTDDEEITNKYSDEEVVAVPYIQEHLKYYVKVAGEDDQGNSTGQDNGEEDIHDTKKKLNLKDAAIVYNAMMDVASKDADNEKDLLALGNGSFVEKKGSWMNGDVLYFETDAALHVYAQSRYRRDKMWIKENPQYKDMIADIAIDAGKMAVSIGQRAKERAERAIEAGTQSIFAGNELKNAAENTKAEVLRTSKAVYRSDMAVILANAASEELMEPISRVAFKESDLE